MSRPDNHADCAAFLHRLADRDGVDIIVSDQPPLVLGPYTQPGMTCPHGVTFWVEPTGEQISQWVRDGVP
jgi:hypothetical protein